MSGNDRDTVGDGGGHGGPAGSTGTRAGAGPGDTAAGDGDGTELGDGTEADSEIERGAGDDGDRSAVAVPTSARTHVCERCGQPFPESEYLALHRGLEHYEQLDETERETFTEAYEREGAEIRRFRLIALGALVLLYFGFLFLYAGFA